MPEQIWGNVTSIDVSFIGGSQFWGNPARFLGGRAILEQKNRQDWEFRISWRLTTVYAKREEMWEIKNTSVNY